MEGPRLPGVTLYSPHSLTRPRGGGGLLALGFPVGHGGGHYLRVNRGAARPSHPGQPSWA